MNKIEAKPKRPQRKRMARRASPRASTVSPVKEHEQGKGNSGPESGRASSENERPSPPLPLVSCQEGGEILAAHQEAPLLPEDVELKLLLEAIYLYSGFDFRNYTRAALKARVLKRVQQEQLRSISELQAAVLRDPAVLDRLVLGLTERPAALFAEPGFYRTFRREVVPWLRTYPFVRLWVAGCAGGAEVFSLAIVLLEAELQDRCRLYATDLSDAIIRQAEAGVWPLAAVEQAAANYRKAGGRRKFAAYYTVEDGNARVSAALRKNILFAAHNPVTDASFNEFHVIFCREAIHDFDPILQAHVHDLFYNSLVPRGLLGLGRADGLSVTLHEADYETFNARHGIFRKKWPNGWTC